MVPLADSERGEQFGLLVDGRENVDVAQLGVDDLESLELLLLFANERPNFIDLDVLQMQVGHVLVEEFAASVSEANQQTHDRVPADASDPLRRANRIPFNQQFQNGKLLFSFHDVGHRIRSHCLGRIRYNSVARLESGGNVWFRFDPGWIAVLPGLFLRHLL